MTTKEIADIAGVSIDTVQKVAREVYPEKFGQGKRVTYLKAEAISVMSLIRKRNFVELPKDAEVLPKDAEVLPQNAKVSFLSEKDIAIISQIVSVTVSETIKALDGRMTNIEQKIEQRKILLPAPQLDARAHIKKMIDEYVSRNGIEHSDAYRYLYREFFYRTKCNASLCAKNRGMKTIDYIDDEGMIETLEAIAMEVL
jgi:histone H3/H4/NACalpha-BTF3-like transcription factor